MRENSGKTTDDAMDEYRLKVKYILAKGFNCHVCSSTSFLFTGSGNLICSECGIMYHTDTVYKIYDK